MLLFSENELPEHAEKNNNEEQVKMCFEAYQTKNWSTLLIRPREKEEQSYGFISNCFFDVDGTLIDKNMPSFILCKIL